jgi:hypothetical protein
MKNHPEPEARLFQNATWVRAPDLWERIESTRPATPIGSRPHRTATILFALAIGIAGVAFAAVRLSDTDRDVAATPSPSLPSTSSITPAIDARVAERVDVGATAGSVAAADGSVWVATYDFDTAFAAVVHIDAATASVINTIPIGRGDLANNIAAGAGAAWVVVAPPHDDPMLVRIDQGTDQITGTVQGISGPLVVDPSGVWAVEGTDLVRIDPVSLSVEARITVGASPLDIAAGGGAIWVQEREVQGDTVGTGPLVRIDPSAATVSEIVPLSASGLWLAASKDGLWVDAWRPDDPHASAAFFVPISGGAPQMAADGYNFRPFAVAEGRVWFVSGPNDPGLPKGGVCGMNVATNAVDVCADPRSIVDLELAHDPAAYDPATHTLWVGEYESSFVTKIDLIESDPSRNPSPG